MIDSISGAEGIEALIIDDILENAVEPGRTILVVGGDQIGMQAADYLSEGGRTVYVAESHGHFAQKLGLVSERRDDAGAPQGSKLIAQP